MGKISVALVLVYRSKVNPGWISNREGVRDFQLLTLTYRHLMKDPVVANGRIITGYYMVTDLDRCSSWFCRIVKSYLPCDSDTRSHIPQQKRIEVISTEKEHCTLSAFVRHCPVPLTRLLYHRITCSHQDTVGGSISPQWPEKTRANNSASIACRLPYPRGRRDDHRRRRRPGHHPPHTSFPTSHRMRCTSRMAALSSTMHTRLP